MQGRAKPNRLIQETSPYLRQHARNPVDWYPWGSEAILRARREDRPIFLSIGYSACHWCHVMEDESFENPEIARLMNNLFVNIKVDREERPDLDRIYMAAVQMMTGSGGWPMSVFLTPELRPFFGGTYFPPEDRWGRPGFPRILHAVAEAYRTRRPEIDTQAETLVAEITNLAAVAANEAPPSSAILEGAAQRIASSLDPVDGGFGGAPKFPMSIALQFLMRRYRHTGETEFLRGVRLSLDRMASGGIYDQIGGGFHRYSTDARWIVPHFEKMLYDNSLLTLGYLEAFQITGDAGYARVARETLDYIMREMTAPDGGFYSTQDADSDGKEGGFFLWTPHELREVLGREEADLFARAYGVGGAGDLEGRCVLHRVKWDGELASIDRVDESGIGQRLAESRSKLFAARERRVKPGRDEKILIDWNGLAISAFARGARVLGDAGYGSVAERAAGFILTRMQETGVSFLHVWTDGTARIPALLDDHANLLVGLADLYEASGNPRWLSAASAVQAAMLNDFWDPQDGGFFDTSARHMDLIARTRNGRDGATPSGNGMAAFGMIRLARLTGEASGLNHAERTLRAFVPQMKADPLGSAQLLIALDLLLAPSQEVAIVGPADNKATRALRAVVDRLFLPQTVVLLGDGRTSGGLAGLEGKGLMDGKPAAYVCRNLACEAPVTTPEELEAALSVSLR